jgi:hypothetical protein
MTDIFVSLSSVSTFNNFDRFEDNFECENKKKTGLYISSVDYGN